jgi:hypothetical protein
MKINAYFEAYGLEWCYVSIYHKLFNKLKETYPEIKFNYIDPNLVRLPKKYNGPACKFGPHFMILENDENKKYFVISYWDKLKDIIVSNPVTNWDVENQVELFTSAGVHKNDYFYAPLDCEYTPISYSTMTIDIEKKIEELYEQKNRRIYPSKLTFRGYLYQFRKFLESDDRFNMISKQTSILSQEEYMKELDKSKLNFNVNGAGEICNRDMEILGLGTALFRTKLVAKFHNELIPNYHYIAVDVDDIEYDEHKHDYNGYWKQLSDKVYNRFKEIRGDRDFIDFVANNGRKWYLENGTIDANVNVIHGLLDFNKLK